MNVPGCDDLAFALVREAFQQLNRTAHHDSEDLHTLERIVVMGVIGIESSTDYGDLIQNMACL